MVLKIKFFKFRSCPFANLNSKTAYATLGLLRSLCAEMVNDDELFIRLLKLLH